DFVRNFSPRMVRWTATMERSEQSTIPILPGGVPERVHLHAFFEFADRVDWSSRSRMRFNWVCPDIQACHARGRDSKAARDQGHFYVYAPKIGTIFVASSSYEPFTNYRVNGRWLDTLWSWGKLTHEQYEDLAIRVRLGAQRRVGQKRFIEEHERQQAQRARQAEVEEALAPLRRPPRYFAAVDDWLRSFDVLHDRYSVLVIRGPSRIGKTTFARSLLSTPYMHIVKDADEPNLRGFDPRRHTGIVLDQVSNAKFCIENRGILQSNNYTHTLAQTQGHTCSYDICVHGVPIIVTLDEDVPDLHVLYSSNWVAENAVVLHETEPLWV
ncbi:MAG: hypothetical protein VYC68_02405, partial [Candidatus Thermoplasmatota archaeon]|nr:hypothetical protein [Candidatus Thermoplasmatota archaeon]